VVGTSQIIAQHGTKDSPHIFYSVDEVEHYSKSVDKLFKHQVLRMGFNYDGPTEIGGLILHPEYRGGPDKLGKQLSFVRFVLMAMYPFLFKKRLLAELLPPFTSEGKSLLWEALGRRFTGLDYRIADHISRSNKEFIKNLFPDGQIYTTLFEEETRNMIGAIGPSSQGACCLLSQIGFTYQQRVDPFDGGPHYECDMADVSIVQNAQACSLQQKEENGFSGNASNRGIIAVLKNAFTNAAEFLALSLEFESVVAASGVLEIQIDKEAMALLHSHPGDKAWVFKF